MDAIPQRLADIRQRLENACRSAGRSPDSVRLVAVSKAVPAERVLEAARAGLRDFGESYAQEAATKQQGHNDLVWHYIGGIQANKTRLIAEHFDWVHSVDREEVAQRLSQQRPPQKPPLNVCVQVNLTAQPGRAGCAPEVASVLCGDIARLPQLRLRGLMILPTVWGDPEQARAAFHALRELLKHIRQLGQVDRQLFDTLSMGMSQDFEIAVAEGATMVRVGTALFGPRNSSSTNRPQEGQ
jgi:pyridoxal phosphate enzyme (YggS family)